VKGLVADLVTIPKENFDASTALEVCAGGMLYFVGSPYGFFISFQN